ncbi:hypothetical protein ES703_49021 [subsurface metagenome]
MKTLPAPKFLIYAVIRAVRHPRTPVTYLYCPDCRLRFHPNEKECPKCHKNVGQSPENRQESPLPWYVAVLCIVIGIGAWIASACLYIPGLGEAARLLVYAPVGHLFGMSIQR